MLEENFIEVYNKFKFEFYRSVFSLVREREGSLSAMETFALEVINQLDQPTIGQFADFLGISQSNATYKVNSLMKKGYLKRENSDQDRREYYLVLSEKYYGYLELMNSYIHKVIERTNERFDQVDIDKLTEILGIVSKELMPEADGVTK